MDMIYQSLNVLYRFAKYTFDFIHCAMDAALYLTLVFLVVILITCLLGSQESEFDLKVESMFFKLLKVDAIIFLVLLVQAVELGFIEGMIK